MADASRRARDLALLDAVDALKREPFEGQIWRVVREGRDPLQASPSLSRWCNGTFDVLYTSLEADGATAEIFASLSLQPVFPSKPEFRLHRLRLKAVRSLRFADLDAMERLGVSGAIYSSRSYERTAEIADAAHFLGFDGIIAPSARWPCSNVVVFTERIAPGELELIETDPRPVDWVAWRKRKMKAS